MSYEVGSRKPRVGDRVLVVQKKDYATGQLTAGNVKDVLTSKEFHPRGHKVRLTSGIIGRVQSFGDEEVASKPPPQTTTPSIPSPDDLA